MSDFRFKICGTEKPFIAEIYRASDDCLISKKLVEYAGEDTPDVCNQTCVIFDGLVQNESYYVKVTDNLNEVTCSGIYQTPSDPVVTPTELNVNLLGSVATTNNSSSNIKTLVQPKYVEFTPALSGTQSVRLTFGIYTNYTDGDGLASATVYCKPNGGTTYSVIASENHRDSGGNFSIDANAGDQICYDMNATSRIINQGDPLPLRPPSGLTYLCLDNVTPLAGFSTCCSITTGPTTNLTVSSCTSIPTTTTTTTGTEVQVYFDNPQFKTTIDPVTNECIVTVGAKLETNPPLESNQCFRLCLNMYNSYTFHGLLNSNMCARSTVYTNNNALKNLVLKNTININNNSASLYYDVCSANINNLCFCARVCDNTTNRVIDHSLASNISICGISNMVNGNYSYDDLSTTNLLRATTKGLFLRTGDSIGDIVVDDNDIIVDDNDIIVSDDNNTTGGGEVNDPTDPLNDDNSAIDESGWSTDN